MIFQRNKKNKNKKKNILIVGSGKLGTHIANDYALNDDNVVLVDQDENILKIVGVKFNGQTVLGDATDVNTLIRAGIETADIVVAATQNDNINIFVSLIAKEIYKVKHVIARLYEHTLSIAYDKLNITTISPSVLSADSIKKFIVTSKEALKTEAKV